MQLQDLKRWQWMLFAVIVGLALSYVWSNWDCGDQLPTITQPDFERGIVGHFPQVGYVTEVTVLPRTHAEVQGVVCAMLSRTSSATSMKYQPVVFHAPFPYTTDRGQSFTSVRDYLASIRSQNADVHFSYAWYRERWAVYILWMAASVLLIGGIFPSVISLMTGGGLNLSMQFEKKPKAKSEEYDLDRFGKGGWGSSGGKTTNGASAADLDELRRLDAELEKRLGAGAGLSGDSTGAGPGDAVDGVRKLDGGPLELTQAQKEQEEREYKGEYYPVAKTVHKKETHR